MNSALESFRAWLVIPFLDGALETMAPAYIGPNCTTCVVRAQMAGKTGAERTIRELKAQPRNDRKDQSMTSTQYTMARTFMTAELFMAAANCGSSVAARIEAESLLDDYFALVEEGVPWTEHNPLDCRS